MERDIEKLIVELAWEVGLVKGGTYTYLWSKSKALHAAWNKSGNAERIAHLLVGPYFSESFVKELRRIETPQQFKLLENCAQKLGIEIYWAEWEKAGNSICLLIDYKKWKADNQQFDLAQELNDKYRIKNTYTHRPVDLTKLNADLIVWSFLVGKLLSEFLSLTAEQQANVHDGEKTGSFRQVVCEAHYPYGVAQEILRQRLTKLELKTIRTMHATHLGYLHTATSAKLWNEGQIEFLSDPNYKLLGEWFNSDEYSIEVLEMRNATAVNAVSRSTFEEIDRYYHLKPALLHPHGFDQQLFEEVSKLEKPRVDQQFLNKLAEKKVISQMEEADSSVSWHYLFTSGRDAEYIKGYELVLEALAKLERKLKANGQGNLRVVQEFYILVYKDEDAERFAQVIESGITSKNFISYHCQRLGLVNGPDNLVKVSVVPRLGPQAQDNAYFQTIRRADLAIFPSLYEPWGYTPVESAALGVPTVTTSASGFGNYLLEKGVLTVNQRGINRLNIEQLREKVVEDLAEIIFRAVTSTPEEARQAGDDARTLVAATTWQKMINNYLQAYASISA